MRRLLLLLGWLGALAPAGLAAEFGTYRFDPGGEVQEVRAADVDGDGRLDLVLLVETRSEAGAVGQTLLVLRQPKAPARGRLFPDDHVTRIPLEAEGIDSAGAVAIGRFGPEGRVRLRFFGPAGVHDMTPGAPAEPVARAPEAVLGRSRGRPLIFWDGVADLDGDGRDESWYPRREDGAMQVLGGVPAGDRVLELHVANTGESTPADLLVRHAYVPQMFPADLDGDGNHELVAFDDGHLVAWILDGDASPLPPAHRMRLPLLRDDLGPDEVHTPRFQLDDVNRDGITDLLVTLVTGDRRDVETFRTQLLHFPGPFRNAETGRLVPPRVRIDTESVAFHPYFTDIDGDGALDYVTDSIRGTKRDLLLRVFGMAPTIWHVAFRFDKEAGTFETTPLFSLERPYARSEAVLNRFGRSAFLADFDGDGLQDLLDLGDLEGLEILGARPKTGRGPGDAMLYDQPLLTRRRVPEPLVGDGLALDLDGDGRADGVLWSKDQLYVLLSKGGS